MGWDSAVTAVQSLPDDAPEEGKRALMLAHVT